MRRRRGLRLVPAAAAAWAASLAAVMAPDAAPALAIVLWSVAILVIVAAAAWTGRGAPRFVRGQVIAVVVLAAAAGAAAASHAALAQPERVAVAELAIDGGRAITVEATVTGKVERRAGGTVAFDAIARRIDIGTEAHAVDAAVVVQVDPADVDHRQSLDVGAVVEIRGTGRAGIPGDRAVLEVTASRGVRVMQPPAGVFAAAADLRRGLVAAVEGLPAPGAGLVPGLAVGDTSAVDQQLDADMKESSLSHLTAVSGANCALVVGLAFVAAAALGARRSVRVMSGMVALTGFVLLVTPEPSVLRAAVMAAVAMLGVLLGRTTAGMAILSLAVAVLLVADPWLSASLGFALSSAATASLLLFARPLAEGISRVLPRVLALALSVPLAAQLACGPLLVLITPVVPVYGVLANLLAEPAAPAATLIGLAACLAAPIPVLRDGLAAVAWIPASWIAATAQTVTSLPGDVVPWVEGWPGAALLGVLGLALGVLVAVGSDGRRRDRLVRGAAMLFVALVVGVTGGAVALESTAGRLTLPPSWSVLACDVGQGDAVLLRSRDAVMLVDTGRAPEPLERCLALAGIDRIDLLVLTHFDMDHVGGVAAVQGRVGTVLHGPLYGPAHHLLAALAAGGARTVDAHQGMAGGIGAARWRVIWPVAGGRAFAPGNDCSVTLDVRGGGIPPTLLLGDLSAAPQRAIVASRALDPPYAIVKVAHHGSADQDAALYEAAAPAVALITVGLDNDYGHPRAETLATLAAVQARIFRTDLDGMIAVSGVAGGIQLWRDHDSVVGADR
ncbi:ComEC/Rec2 family competence protein [Microbacterium deminutum]|uniref:ComEC/Rec2 family competence protein n=1 Tax=Microbacterium deminutum TaxID=344164 RepID=A0ABP5BT24_9MICO